MHLDIFTAYTVQLRASWEAQRCNQLASANWERWFFLSFSFLYLGIKMSLHLLRLNLKVHSSPSLSPSLYLPHLHIHANFSEWEEGRSWGRGGWEMEGMNVFQILGWNVSSHPPLFKHVPQIWRWWSIQGYHHFSSGESLTSPALHFGTHCPV